MVGKGQKECNISPLSSQKSVLPRGKLELLQVLALFSCKIIVGPQARAAFGMMAETRTEKL
jgi:hypothetical protein